MAPNKTEALILSMVEAYGRYAVSMPRELKAANKLADEKKISLKRVGPNARIYLCEPVKE